MKTATTGLATGWTTGSTAWLLLGALLSSCVIGDLDTTPLEGPTPASVLVLPVRNESGLPIEDLRALATGADRALQDRGYRVLPLDVGFDVARAAGLVTAEPPDSDVLFGIYRAAAVDAVLIIEVGSWLVEGHPPVQADWAMSWRLMSTRNGAQLWQHREVGQWLKPESSKLDPTRSLDAPPDVIPFGELRQSGFRSAAELAQILHRAAMARLPHRDN